MTGERCLFNAELVILHFTFAPSRASLLQKERPKLQREMKKLIVTTLLLAATGMALAQETHYHKGLRSQEENDKYGGVGADPNFNGGGVYWSRVRNVDDTTISAPETKADSVARVRAFSELCRKAYDAYEAGDAYHTIVYGDSALQKRYHTPDLYFFMAVSFEKLGEYSGAEWAYKKAMKAGYVPAPKAYAAFKKRMKERKAEMKKQRKAK